MVKQIPTYTPEWNGSGVIQENAISTGKGVLISWQNGAMNLEENGATVELVLRACIDRLAALNTKLPHKENPVAVRHITSAIAALERRTADRSKRSVLGSMQE
jgi:hypothetical protein